jgi:hypothetical protein
MENSMSHQGLLLSASIRITFRKGFDFYGRGNIIKKEAERFPLRTKPLGKLETAVCLLLARYQAVLKKMRNLPGHCIWKGNRTAGLKEAGTSF